MIVAAFICSRDEICVTPIFEAFDRPSANSSCACRNVSTTAPQSLHLLNSAFSLKMSRHLANQIVESTPNEFERVSEAFRRVLGRLPTPDELNAVSQISRKNARQRSADASLSSAF